MRMLLVMFGTALAVVSCAPVTPEARIAREPEKFAALPAKQQELVRQGHITRGMQPDAVALAWGYPDNTYQGMRGSTSTMRWDYTSTRPVYSTHYHGSYGYGFTGFGPYGRYSSLGFALGPEVAYVPYRRASVWFENNRVDGWEQAR